MVNLFYLIGKRTVTYVEEVESRFHQRTDIVAAIFAEMALTTDSRLHSQLAPTLEI